MNIRKLSLSVFALLSLGWLFFVRDGDPASAEEPVPVRVVPLAKAADARPEAPPGGASHSGARPAPESATERVHAGAPADWSAMLWRETVWDDFKHSALLEAELEGRHFHAVANHLLVTLAEDASAAPLAAWAAEADDREIESLGGGVHLLRWGGDSGAETFARQIVDLRARLGPSAHVEPDLILRAAAEPDDPLYPSQHHLPAIHTPEGWAVRREAPEIVVAVLDSGIVRNHPDLAARVRPRPGEIPDTGRDDDGNGFVDDAYGWNFVEDNNDTFDHDGHGTMMAGIIGAHGNNALGVTGVAWDVTLMPVVILDGLGRGTTSDEIRAINYILDSDVHIVNASYGGPGRIEASRSRHAALRDAGIWVVAAAGNESADIDRYPVYPAAHGFENIITVAAADKERRPAAFSNTGLKTVDLFAPGTDIWATAQTGDYAARSGTSQAAAVVSGGLALVLAEHPQAEHAEIRSRIIDRARHAPALVGKSVSGALLDLGHAMAPGEGRAPRITVHPESVEGQYGDTLVLRAETVSSAGTEMVWFFNGDALDVRHGPELIIGPFIEADEGEYHLVVRDVFGEVVSETATVTMEKEPPTILRATVAATIVTGQTVELFFETDGSPPRSYQWYRDGEPVPGATSPRLVIPGADASHAGNYVARVTSPWGMVETAPVPVRLDPVEELDWHFLADFPPREIRRVGGIYVGHYRGHALWSGDLAEWRSAGVPFAADNLHSGLVHAFGAYWAVDVAGRLRRSEDLDTWEAWVDLPTGTGAPWEFWQITAGADRMIVRRPGSGYVLVDPVARTALAAADPTAGNTGIGSISYGDGAFFYYGGTLAGIFRSVNGLDWTPYTEVDVYPVFEDPLTGSVLGMSGNRWLFTHGGDGLWRAFSPFETHVQLTSGTRFATFPGGFQAGEFVHDFRDGRSWTVHPPDISNVIEVTHHYDHDRSLVADRESGGRVFRIEYPDTGAVRMIVPPRVDESTLPGEPALIEAGGRVYRYALNRLYELLPSGQHVQRDERGMITYLGSAGGEALFRAFAADDRRFFRIGAEGFFEAVETDPVLDAAMSVSAGGGGFYGMVSPGTDFWTSEDGRTWRPEPPFAPPAPTRAVLRDGVWVAASIEIDWGWRLRVLRRETEDSEWQETLIDEGGGEPYLNLFSAVGGFLLRAGDVLHFSADGAEWTSLESHFTSVFSVMEPRGDVFLVLGQLADSGSGQVQWYGSRNGTDWFATDPEVYPVARGSAVAFRFLGSALQGARLAGADHRASPVLVIEGSGVAREVPAVWEVKARLPDADRAVALELWSDGKVVAAANPDESRFAVWIDQPGMRHYEVRVLYDDGWATASGSFALVGTLPLETTAGRVFPDAGLEPPTRYFTSAERAFAVRLFTGQVYSSVDGFEWTELAGTAPAGLFPQRAYSAADGTFAVGATASPDSPNLGWVIYPGAAEIEPLPKPDGTRGYFGDLFAFDGKIHALMGDGRLFRLDGPGPQWAFVREPVGFPQSTSPIGPDVRVFERGGVYLVPSPEASYLTTDFRHFTRLPHPDGWTRHEGFLFVRGDRRAFAVLEWSSGRLRTLVETEAALEAFQDLGNGTFIAVSGGVRHIVLADGSLLPLHASGGTVTLWHAGTRLFFLSASGDVLVFEANDFILADVAVTDTEAGPFPTLSARVGVANNGILGMGSGVHLAVRGWLEPSGAPDEAVLLGDREVDASGLVPGGARAYSLHWQLPPGTPLGDYRLRVEVNADRRIDETNTDNNVMRSPVFAYNPEISLLVEPSRHGSVLSDQVKASMPFGTLVNIEALPSEGFRFLGWNGALDPDTRVTGIEMTRRHILHAHFVPARLHDAFPALAPVGTTGWYEEDGDYLYPESLDWTYSADHGWLFTSEAEGVGTWFWTAAAGWLWKPAGLPAYYDGSAGVWLWRGAE